MAILQTIILVLFFLCCAILIFLVMLQSGKGGGLSLVGGGGNAMQSSRVDPIARATWYAGFAFFALAIVAAVTFADSGPGNLDEQSTIEANTEQTTPSTGETTIPDDTAKKNDATQDSPPSTGPGNE